MIFLSPSELNALIAAITSYLYCSLPEKEFTALSLFLSLLSKQMFTIVALREICDRDDRIVVANVID